MADILHVVAEEVDPQRMRLVDARKKPGSTQIRGSFRYEPGGLLKPGHLEKPLPRNEPLVVYADTDEKARKVAERLYRDGYADVAVLTGGLTAWSEVGLPVEPA